MFIQKYLLCHLLFGQQHEDHMLLTKVFHGVEQFGQYTVVDAIRFTCEEKH